MVGILFFAYSTNNLGVVLGGACSVAPKLIHDFTKLKGQGSSGRPPPPIIFERQILPQQTIYSWKGNLTASRIQFNYWKNILISRFYEQFSRNGFAMALERLFKKIFKLTKYEHIIYHFEARGLEISNI